MTNEEIQGIFFTECEEALVAAEGGLDACRNGTQDSDTVNAIFRAVHSIKGGAGAFGFTALQAFTHGFETLLSDVREGFVPVSDPLVSLMLRALDTLSDHVTAAQGGTTPPDDAALLAELAAAQSGNASADHHDDHAAEEPAPEETASVEELVDLDFDLDALLCGIADETETTDGQEEREEAVAERFVSIRFRAGAMENGSEPVLLLRELQHLGAQCVACDWSAIPSLDHLDPAQAYLRWTFSLSSEIEDSAVLDIFDFIGDDCVIEFGTDASVGAQSFQAEIAIAEPQPVQEKAPEPVAAVAPEPAPIPMAVAPAAETPIPAPTPQPQAEAPAKPEKAEAKPAAAPAAVAAASQSIRIDLAKLDKLIDSVGELVIAQAMMAQRLAGHGLTAIEELTMLDSLTRDIQESAMSIRAQPIGSVFSRVPRIIRELEASTGKRVGLQVSGESTELDKTVIERLGEPLTHLIRNAVDHGLETPEDRKAAGKSPVGTLFLSAEQRSGRILIKIGDDGAGINRERVLAKAIEKKLIAPEAQLSNEEIDNLIFAPGFSTAATISNISGRGVGMDVVRQNVKDLGGRITIDSKPGHGTTFTLALPLTLAISEGMIVTVGDQTLVVPLAHVVESLRPDPNDVQLLGNNRRMLNVRGHFIPVLPLQNSVGAIGAVNSPSEGVLIVVDTETAGQAALLVDNICDQRQFVIKSLDTHYRAVDGVAGATILGDGRVALILDVDGLVANAVVSPTLQEAA